MRILKGNYVRLAAAMVVLSTAPLACGGKDEATSTTRQASTTSSTATADGGGSSTSSSVAPKSSSTTSGGDDASGEPDDGEEALSDGEHVVFISSIDLADSKMTVDLVELLTGQAAADAYLEDQGEELDGELFYLRNRNDKLRTLPVGVTAGPFSIIDAATCCDPTDVGFGGLAEAQAAGFPEGIGTDPPFTVVVSDGEVTSAVQMYVP